MASLKKEKKEKKETHTVEFKVWDYTENLGNIQIYQTRRHFDGHKFQIFMNFLKDCE